MIGTKQLLHVLEASESRRTHATARSYDQLDVPEVSPWDSCCPCSSSCSCGGSLKCCLNSSSSAGLTFFLHTSY